MKALQIVNKNCAAAKAVIVCNNCERSTDYYTAERTGWKGGEIPFTYFCDKCCDTEK